MRVTENYVLFWNDEFSNFQPVTFEHKGEKFLTTEQAFMWEKAKFFKDEEIAAEVLKTAMPYACKKLGRKVKGFDGEAWGAVCYEIMLNINRHKYLENALFKVLLKNTGSRTIVEASPYDKVWGVGLGENHEDIEDESKWDGQNLLGKVLMELREEIYEEISNSKI